MEKEFVIKKLKEEVVVWKEVYIGEIKEKVYLS